MKVGPLVAMAALLLVGLWMVLQPTLSSEAWAFEVRVGAVEIRAADAGEGTYEIVEPDRLRGGAMTRGELMAVVDAEVEGWESRPGWERTLLGFFNITGWTNFGFVAVGLLGQGAFFGRMFVQWVVSEKNRRSEVPEIFWWLSLIGGLSLFVYFVWRKDAVGVLGQSTGVVIYARNLRLIHKQRRREEAENSPDLGDDLA